MNLRGMVLALGLSLLQSSACLTMPSDALPSASDEVNTVSEGEHTSEDGNANDFVWPLPPDIAPPPVPDDNPQSAAKVALGRYLFYDTRLSQRGNRACGVCHEPAKGYTDGFPRALGTSLEIHPRNTLPLTNVAYRSALGWDRPVRQWLETQMRMPLFNTQPHELGMLGREREVLQRLADDPIYSPLFVAAFPDENDPLHLTNVVRAIAAFERTLLSFDSPYDRHLRGDPQALSKAARAGLALFSSPQLACSTCHAGPNLDLSVNGQSSPGPQKMTTGYYNIGLYDVDGHGAYPPGNQGIIHYSGQAADMGKFRTPTLRNVARSAPYMHDGSVPDLKTVLDLFAAGGRQIVSNLPTKGDGRQNPFKDPRIHGFEMTAAQREQLLAFLEALTDESFLNRPDLQNPWLSRDGRP